MTADHAAPAPGSGAAAPVHAFVDVDGVLCPLHWDTPTDWGWDTEPARAVCDGLRVLWAPALVARLRDLFDSPEVTVSWLTTWFHTAPEHLAPALGWEQAARWPVVGRDAYDAYDTPGPAGGETGAGEWWKLRVVRDRAVDVLAAGGRVLWVDDDAADPDTAAWVADQDPDRVLVVAPARHRGLSVRDVERIEAWLSGTGTSR